MKTDVYNQQAEKAGSVDLPDSVFGVAWNEGMVHQVLVAIQANRRTTVAHAKTRSEVRGGGRKPWRQKGTGRARHGSIRSPLWAGGGVTFGPRNERNFSVKINKKMRRKALFSALSRRFNDGDLRVVESLAVEGGKTKDAAAFIGRFAAEDEKRPTFLLVLNQQQQDLVRATKNLEDVRVITADSLNVEDVLKYKSVLLEKDAVETIAEHYRI